MLRRLPARAISDLCLTESEYKADFDIASKFQSFSSEILKLSLLGIGLFGFILSHCGNENGVRAQLLSQTLTYERYVQATLVLFGLASACALLHGFLSTKCLGYQIHILRLLKRQDSTEWTDDEKKSSRHEVVKLQRSQRRILAAGIHSLGLACLFLGVGGLAISIAFVQAIHDRAKNNTMGPVPSATLRAPDGPYGHTDPAKSVPLTPK